jgi:hypothetical protein
MPEFQTQWSQRRISFCTFSRQSDTLERENDLHAAPETVL